MKVKIGNKIYDSNKEPILLFLSDQDKKNIANMDNSATKFCSYPDTISEVFIEWWMKEVE